MAKQKPDFGEGIKAITGVFLARDEKKDDTNLNLWAYTFTNPYDITSITLLKSTRYILKKEE